jgi:hypothetical protein
MLQEGASRGRELQDGLATQLIDPYWLQVVNWVFENAGDFMSGNPIPGALLLNVLQWFNSRFS